MLIYLELQSEYHCS